MIEGFFGFGVVEEVVVVEEEKQDLEGGLIFSDNNSLSSREKDLVEMGVVAGWRQWLSGWWW